MLPLLRQDFNAAFTPEKYQAFLDHLDGLYNYKPTFRIGETPIFVSDDFRDKLIRACEDINDVLCRPD